MDRYVLVAHRAVVLSFEPGFDAGGVVHVFSVAGQRGDDALAFDEIKHADGALRPLEFVFAERALDKVRN